MAEKEGEMKWDKGDAASKVWVRNAAKVWAEMVGGVLCKILRSYHSERTNFSSKEAKEIYMMHCMHRTKAW